jgi:CheY-like chemotaxis protein/anti-sigma regulatory factor (Ser/Thr protein kinase)
LINDILDFAKIRAGKADIVPEDVRLEQFCRPALATIHRLAADKGISVEAPDAYPDILMHVDPLRCKQILLNLLGNAIKFTPAGGRLGLKITHDPLSDWVLCTVWDTGIGIPAHDLDKLFQPFTQLDTTLARSYGGAGLGLCLAQRLAEQQGGQVTVTSKPGSGSQFTLQLPLPPLRQPVPLARAVPSPGLSTANILHRSPARILVVDDVQINGEIYRDYLERKGFQVMLAKNGAEALVLASNERPDVILMDIQMPVMDGLEATRRLRAAPDPTLAVTPVVALTALAMAGDEQRCLDAGCDTYLEKPVRLDALLRSVTEQVQRRDDAVAAQRTRTAASISDEAYRAP